MILLPEDYRQTLHWDLASFIERSFYELNPQTSYLRNWHIELIASKLERCLRGEIRRLIINLPPRHLKSICSSVAFPAWYLGHHPGRHVICASYGQDLADKLARDGRKLMQSAWYRAVFATRLAEERRAMHDFMTTAQGTRMSTSVDGVLTGRGADLIIIDDPLKPAEALSETRRNAVNEWYDNTLLSRLNSKESGCIVIIMQRLHQDDLVGHVQQQEMWDVLSFPAIAEVDEEHRIESLLGARIVRRKAGEALHPERESLATLRALRQTMTQYNFVSQYQQNPQPRDGVMVKPQWFMRYGPDDLPIGRGRRFQSWDTANKASELANYSVCTTWLAVRDRYYLLDVFRARLEYPELKRKVRELAHKYSASAVVIEDKASGTQLLQELKSEGLFQVKPHSPTAGMDKEMRLNAQLAVFEAGQVYLPPQAPWLADYEAELTSFPGSRHSDQVDSTTQALEYMRTKGRSAWSHIPIS